MPFGLRLPPAITFEFPEVRPVPNPLLTALGDHYTVAVRTSSMELWRCFPTYPIYRRVSHSNLSALPGAFFSHQFTHVDQRCREVLVDDGDVGADVLDAGAYIDHRV